MKLNLFFLVSLFINNSIYAQWLIVGNSDFADSYAQYMYTSVSPQGIPYVIYRDASSLSSGRVKKFDGTDWISIGYQTFSNYIITNCSMAFDSADIPYITYMDWANGKKATVQKFDGTNWQSVGNAGFTDSAASFTSIAINKNGTPYLAFRDVGNNYRASVMKFNGNSWVYVGNAGFSAMGSGQAGALYTSLAIDSNSKIYVAYTELSNNFHATVMKYDGNSWSYVGSPDGISAGSANFTTIVIDSYGTPYVAYEDNANGSKATVKKFDGTNWIPIGIEGFTPGIAEYPFLSIDSYNNLYVVFQDYTKDKKASVMMFDGNNWVYVGNPGFSASEAMYTTMGIDNNTGTLYAGYEVVYTDTNGNPTYDATVMKYAITTGIKQRNGNSLLMAYPNPSTGIISVNYTADASCSLQLTVTNSLGVRVYSEHIGQLQKELTRSIDLSKAAKGIYFIEIIADRKIEIRKIVLN